MSVPFKERSDQRDGRPLIWNWAHFEQPGPDRERLELQTFSFSSQPAMWAMWSAPCVFDGVRGRSHARCFAVNNRSGWPGVRSQEMRTSRSQCLRSLDPGCNGERERSCQRRCHCATAEHDYWLWIARFISLANIKTSLSKPLLTVNFSAFLWMYRPSFTALIKPSFAVFRHNFQASWGTKHGDPSLNDA